MVLVRDVKTCKKTQKNWEEGGGGGGVSFSVFSMSDFPRKIEYSWNIGKKVPVTHYLSWSE